MIGDRSKTGTGGGHIPPETLLDYIEDRVPDDRAFEVEEHLSGCKPCMRLIRQLGQAASLIDDWSATRHGAAVARAAISAALASAAHDPRGERWAGRLDRWNRVFAARAQGIARVAVDETRRAGLVLGAGLESLLTPGGWEFVPVAKARGAAVKVLQVRGHPESRVAVTEGTTKDGRKFETVTVSLPQALTGPEPPLAMAIDASRPEAYWVAELREEGGFMKAVFLELPPGEYILILEPSVRKL
jgi:hypothetical protein